MAGLTAERVAEIIVETATDERRRGSGYLVAPGRVLTAAHIVASAVSVRVRFEADRPGERVLEAEVRFEHPLTDVAVLAVPLDEVPVTRFGRVGERDAVLRCSAMGFPAFKMRGGEDGRPYRDAEHVHGTCAVLSNRREGTLDLSVPPPDGPWDGMSGAAVFSGDRIVGVVAAHHHADGAGRLAVSRADRWAERLSGDQLGSIERELSSTLAGLPDVLPPSRLGQIEAGYQALLRDIAPPELKGRAEELRELVDFCAGPETYRWVQGRPWTGKTALVSWFALHPPRGVVPVSFFITSRLAGQADSTAYTEAVVHQLAAIVGREPSPHASPGVRETERRALLIEAAERVAEDGATLLLVVDGLDEDQSARDGATGPSIASLLPERLPPGVRVLVTSRPNPGLPLDVASGHPLRGDVVRQLSSTGYARHLEHDARFELSRALAGDDLEKDIVGLLAAARGSLRPEDLWELTGHQLYAVRQRVNGVFGRILRRRGHSSRDLDERGYLFAHETLFVAAAEMLGPDVRPYLERVHGWADEYRRRGWPEETPPYLLQQYARMVSGLGDVDRATVLTTDPRRQDRMRAVTGSDAAALAEIDAVRTMAAREAPDDLGTLAALGAAEGLVSRRNSSLPWNLPVVMARLGHARRAEGLARSVFDVQDRARSLVGVAQTMAECGDGRAAELAREAVALVYRVWFPTSSQEEAELQQITHAAAVTLAALGRGAEALELVTEQDDMTADAYGIDHSPAVLKAFVELAEAVRPHDARLADRTLDDALTKAHQLALWGWTGVVATVATAYARVRPARSAELFDDMEELALQAPPDGVAELWTVAFALRQARPESAARLAKMASTRVITLLETDTSDDALRAGRQVLKVLVDCGLLAEAQDLADAHPEIGPDISTVLAKGWAREGEAARAWQLLRAAYGPDIPYDAHSSVAGGLASAGALDEAERMATEIESPVRAAETLGVVAEHAVRHDPARALRLLEAALETAPRSLAGNRGVDQQLHALVDALVISHDFSHAGRLARWFDGSEERAEALAELSIRLHATDPAGARRLAEEAADELDSVEDRLPSDAERPSPAGLSYCERAVMRALAGVGLHTRWLDLCKRAGSEEPAVWEDSPEEAEGLMGATAGYEALDYAELILAAGREAPWRVPPLLRMLRDRMTESSPWFRDLSAETYVVGELLLGGLDPDSPQGVPDIVVRLDVDAYGPPGPDPHGPVALVCAACGDYERAEDMVKQLDDDENEPVVRAEMAAAILGLPWLPWFERSRLALVRRCVDLLMPRPPADADRIERAREQLRRALMCDDGWHHALPVLAHLDPDAVRRVRDVVFAHLGLDVSDEPPAPAPA
ncbi:trypsin-like peptidase domain-containing protein [Streptomyces sp. NPDC059850]|uniref:trypsin-like peptidase domain-containing protein n=1 Tax=Streptomyces sp. NPDC059850 TaxID=3346970 RepID=UPI003667F867